MYGNMFRLFYEVSVVPNNLAWKYTTHIFSSNLLSLWPCYMEYGPNTVLILCYFYTYAFGTSTKKRSLQSPFVHKHHTVICIRFLIMFPVSDTIWLNLSDLEHIWRLNWINFPNSKHHFWFESEFPIQFIHHFWFNLTQFSDLIWLPLHPFESPFPINLSFYDYIWLTIYNSILIII